MKPDVPVVLAAFAEILQGELSVQLGGSYAGQQVLRGASLMPSFAIEFDRAAARRVEENKALRALFELAAPQVDEPELKQALRQAAESQDSDLRITALQQGNDLLRALLIRLQGWAENGEPGRTQPVLDAIWLELKRSTERRALPLDRL